MSAILAVIMVFLTMPLTAFGETKTESIPTLTDVLSVVVDSRRATAGETVSIDIYVENNPGIAGLIITAEYNNSALNLVSVTNGNLMSTITVGKNIVFNNTINCTESGLLVTLTFEVDEDAALGDYEIKCIVRECSNESLEAVPTSVVSGTLSVIDIIYGDADGNGAVNLNDVLLISTYLANYDYETGVPSIEVSAGADADGNGVINLNDAVLLCLYLANYNYDTGSSDVILGPVA